MTSDNPPETCDQRGFKRSRIVSPVSRPAPVREGIVLGLPVAVNDFQLAKYDAANLFFCQANTYFHPHTFPFR